MIVLARGGDWEDMKPHCFHRFPLCSEREINELPRVELPEYQSNREGSSVLSAARGLPPPQWSMADTHTHSHSLDPSAPAMSASFTALAHNR